MTTLDPTLLPALTAVLESLDRPAPRHYAPQPAEDYHVHVFRMQCERDEKLRELMERNEDEAERALGGRSYEDWCESEMGYHGDRR